MSACSAECVQLLRDYALFQSVWSSCKVSSVGADLLPVFQAATWHALPELMHACVLLFMCIPLAFPPVFNDTTGVIRHCWCSPGLLPETCHTLACAKGSARVLAHLRCLLHFCRAVSDAFLGRVLGPPQPNHRPAAGASPFAALQHLRTLL